MWTEREGEGEGEREREREGERDFLALISKWLEDR